MMRDEADGEPLVHLSTPEDAVERHAPFDWRTRYGVGSAAELQEATDATAHWVSVMAVDVRRSTALGLETDPFVFARIMKEFIDYSWIAVRSLGGWFDRFTGDGFLAYRPHGTHVEGEIEPGHDSSVPRTVAGLVFLAHLIRHAFDETTLPLLRRSARNWPRGAGLAIGLDAGRCQQMFVGDDITLMGPPIIGAARMVESAKAGEIVVNLGLGQRLADQVDRGLWSDAISLKPTARGSKEYPSVTGGQEAYLLSVADPEALLDASGENPALLRSALAKLPYDPSDGETLQRVDTPGR